MPAFDGLRRLLSGAGYGFVEPPILQDADIFLDLAGEDLRRRLFLTPSADGVELCLRPEYTIPVCLHHLTSGAPGRPGSYAYLGPVFRQRSGETGEFLQAGVESIGRADTVAADADALALAVEATAVLGVGEPRVRIGDSALFSAVLDALEIPDVWRRRLARAFGDRPRLDALLARLGGSGEAAPPHAGFLAALDGADHAGARRLVDDLLTIAGITTVGGRSAGEIADRFLEQAAMQAGAGVSAATQKALKDFLEVRGNPIEAVAALGGLAGEHGVTLGEELDGFLARNAGLAKRGIDLERIAFAADFGRRLDYYTGFVFDIHDGARPGVAQIVGGGRYDRLLSLIATRDGSGADIPAVGFSIWLDRIGAGGTP